MVDYTNSIKYLGFTFSSVKKNDNDMLRQMGVFYTKANRLLRLFHCCFQPMLNLLYFVVTVLAFRPYSPSRLRASI